MGIHPEKMQELSKQEPDKRATAWKAKLDWELEKVTSLYFCRQLTIRVTYSGIRSIPQVERPNNFLNQILIGNFAIELMQLKTNFQTLTQLSCGYGSGITGWTSTTPPGQDSTDQAPHLHVHMAKVLTRAEHLIMPQNQGWPGESEPMCSIALCRYRALLGQ